MKFLCLWGTLAVMFCAFSANCQVIPPLNQHPAEKAALFNQLPEKISCPVTFLQNIFSATVNSNVSVSISPQMKVEGFVLTRVAISPEQLSINIRCTNYQNALMNISRITERDGSVIYTGRMVSPVHGDILMLWHDNGQYTFTRQQQLLSLVE